MANAQLKAQEGVKAEERASDAATGSKEARAKIRTLPELQTIARQARAAGRAVVLAHGVFDLLHMGHVRHLEEARRQGDMLIVTLTADRFVNKGPGRPVFTEPLRAEMLGALAAVDYVGVSQDPSAAAVLEAIQPAIYVKGPDYANEADDVTGNIARERNIVEAHNGRMHITEDIVFSSSSLINRYLNVYEPEVASFLAALRDAGELDHILTALDDIAKARVLLIGEAIIDEYDYCSPMGKSAKESIIATRYQDCEVFAGGVIASANHVAGFVEKVDVITIIGDDDAAEDLINQTVRPNVTVHAIRRPERPTIRKVRYVESGHMRKLFEVYHFSDDPLNLAEERLLADEIAALIDDFDVVTVNDFGHGMMTPFIIDQVIRQSPFLAVNAQTNSANLGYNPVTRYPRADFICIDAPEARLAVRDRFSDLKSLVSDQLCRKVDCDNVIVTHGQHGCVTFDKYHGASEIPAFTRQVVDTVGAGDAFLSIAAPLVAVGAPMHRVGVIGNAVGALKVGIVGHRQFVERASLVKFLTALLK